MYVADRAATTSSPGRKEVNIYTIKSAADRQNQNALLLAITSAAFLGDTPSRVAPSSFLGEKVPPALAVVQGFSPMNGRVKPLRSFQR